MIPPPPLPRSKPLPNPSPAKGAKGKTAAKDQKVAANDPNAKTAAALATPALDADPNDPDADTTDLSAAPGSYAATANLLDPVTEARTAAAKFYEANPAHSCG